MSNSVRRSRRSAAAAAETRIARVVEEDSDENSEENPSRPQSSSSSSDSSDNASDDADFDAESVRRNKNKTGPKKSATATTTAPLSSSNSAPKPTTPSTAESPYKELDDNSLKSLMRSFRLTDLQALLIFVGKNKAGRKTDLMERANELVDTTSGDIKKRLSEKIQELSAAMFKSISSAPSVNPYSATYVPPVPAPVSLPSIDNYQNIPSVPRYQPSFPAPSYNRDNNLMYPERPDVKLRNLPFYKIEDVLMKPSSLQPRNNQRFNEQNFSFHLTPQQASQINQGSFRDTCGRQDFKKQIQLRFSLLETSCEQDDNFPASITVKVNGRLQTLPNPIPTNKPGVEPKRPPKPINVTPLCKLSSTVPNYINVTWAVEVGSGYTVSVYYVEKLSSLDLMNELKKKGKRHSDYTRAVIKDKLSDKDNEIATTSCKVSLACPLGKMRMTLPCRSSTCDHLQCFDANLYLMMNEKKPKWMCPVCNKPALYENLLIDGYFSDVLASKRLPLDEHEIVLNSDASWDPLVIPKKTEENQQKPPSPKMSVETLDIDDDDENFQAPVPQQALPKKPSSKEVDYVTLDSDDDEVIAPPAGKRPRLVVDDSDSNNSVSAVTPPNLPNGNLSPEIICLDDD